MTINSGSGDLTLAADVTAAGAGDDGTGTLTIASGATVTSTDPQANAITLRGADVSIDTSLNPAVVGGQHSTNSTATADYRVVDSSALAFDSHGNLYVANSQGTTVSEFPARDASH